ncbi:uncharacterized protein LOC128206169 [Mya arenaria]|uniref:uncharacterized protein LOC128206169 n=1 Tax=Mya arenaria TaxID=6604 RepID=UPI0022E5F9A0|nr:uncharacterized protein LOC128206169 [Mya arenaria]
MLNMINIHALCFVVLVVLNITKSDYISGGAAVLHCLCQSDDAGCAREEYSCPTNYTQENDNENVCFRLHIYPNNSLNSSEGKCRIESVRFFAANESANRFCCHVCEDFNETDVSLYKLDNNDESIKDCRNANEYFPGCNTTSETGCLLDSNGTEEILKCLSKNGTVIEIENATVICVHSNKSIGEAEGKPEESNSSWYIVLVAVLVVIALVIGGVYYTLVRRKQMVTKKLTRTKHDCGAIYTSLAKDADPTFGQAYEQLEANQRQQSPCEGAAVDIAEDDAYLVPVSHKGKQFRSSNMSSDTQEEFIDTDNDSIITLTQLEYVNTEDDSDRTSTQREYVNDDDIRTSTQENYVNTEDDTSKKEYVNTHDETVDSQSVVSEYSTDHYEAMDETAYVQSKR